MKCHILFSEKNKKNISKCRLLKILPRVLSVKQIYTHPQIYISVGNPRDQMTGYTEFVSIFRISLFIPNGI